MKIPQTGKRMSSADAIHCEVGQRVALSLRQVYRDNAAKRIARDFEVDERTAKGWLAGSTPQGKHLLALMHRLGDRFVGAVMVPVGDWASIVAARARLDALQAEYDNLGRDLAGLREEHGTPDRDAGALARVARAPAAAARAASHGEGAEAAGEGLASSLIESRWREQQLEVDAERRRGKR